ncbi:Uncharacterised protein [uncultured archaeon]|nr:Uncharacterised protein [uncultured archaeon]
MNAIIIVILIIVLIIIIASVFCALSRANLRCMADYNYSHPYHSVEVIGTPGRVQFLSPQYIPFKSIG